MVDSRAILPRLLLGLASATYLVSLFCPWEDASFPGRLYGWDTLLGVTSGLAAFFLLVATHANASGRLHPLFLSYGAFGLAFFTAARLINENVRGAGYTPAWGAYVGVAAAACALVLSFVLLAGGWRSFANALPGWLRIDRI